MNYLTWRLMRPRRICFLDLLTLQNGLKSLRKTYPSGGLVNRIFLSLQVFETKRHQRFETLVLDNLLRTRIT